MSKLQKQIVIDSLGILAVTLIIAFIFGCQQERSPNYSSKFDQIDVRLDELEKRSQILELALNEVILLANENDNEIAALQAQAVLLTAQLAQVQQGLNIVAIVDPCGDGPGYDEIGLRTDTGAYVFYRHVNGHGHLIVLQDNVVYETTDKSKCKFKTLNGLLIEL